MTGRSQNKVRSAHVKRTAPKTLKVGAKQKRKRGRDDLKEASSWGGLSVKDEHKKEGGRMTYTFISEGGIGGKSTVQEKTEVGMSSLFGGPAEDPKFAQYGKKKR